MKILTIILTLLSIYIPLNSKDWTFTLNANDIRMESASVNKPPLWFKKERGGFTMCNLSFFNSRGFVGTYKDTSVQGQRGYKKWPSLYLSNTNAEILKWDEKPSFNPIYIASGYPLLLKNKEYSKLPKTYFARRNCPRTAVGIKNDGKVIIYITTSSTLANLQRRMLELGCISAINFDGGGSTFVFVDGVMLHPNKLSRTFPNVLIWKNLP
jgi:hypothetical protein